MNRTYRIADLFCCQGGSAVGLHRAGFEVVGYDIAEQPRYPFEFHRQDALTVDLRGFDAVWASPPCQAYTRARNNGCHKDAPELIEPTRDLLKASGLPYIIENVERAPLINPVTICGAAFGLGVAGFDLNRHRIFESNFFLFGTDCTHRRGQTIGVYGNGTNAWHRNLLGRCIKVDEMRAAMGIEWMSRKGLSQAIPPAYAQYLGTQLLAILERMSAPERDAEAVNVSQRGYCPN